MRPPRSIPAAVLAAWLMLSVTGEALAQVDGGETTTTSTTAPEGPVPTTWVDPAVPAPPTSTPPQPADTTAPGPPPTTATTTTTTPPPPAAPGAEPPAVGGDAAPVGPPPAIPPEIQAMIDSVRRTGSNSTVRLLEALAPLRAMGMTDQEAIQTGFGRFPVAGRATFGDDWWYPRFGPAVGQVRLHEGTDIFAPYGTAVRAPANGVLKQTFNRLGGLSAYVYEPDGTYYYLAHLSRYEAGQLSGQAVRTGDVLGYVGDSGNARGSSPHVHFEIHPGGRGPVNPKPRLDAWLKEALSAVPRLVAEAAPRLASRPTPQAAAEEQDLLVAGHTDLGGEGGNGDVAVVGDTALVVRGFVPPGARSPAPGHAPHGPVGADGEAAAHGATGSDGEAAAGAAGAPLPSSPSAGPPGDGPGTCEGSVTVVELSDPTSPGVAATISLPAGQRAEDVDALAVRTPSFTGDLAAIAVAPCRADGATGLAYYDVTDPRRPRLLSQIPLPRELADGVGGSPACAEELRGTCPRTGRSVELRRRADGGPVSLSSATGAVTSPADVYAVDLRDPGAPEARGWLPVPGTVRPAASNDGCSPVSLTTPAPPREEGLPGMVDVAGFRWDTEARYPARAGAGAGVDGEGSYPVVVEGGGRRLALASEDHWWSSTWAVRVSPPAAAAGDKLGCPGPTTVSSGAAGPTAGALVYVGRGCPERRGLDGAVVPPDPYLADPAGRIAVADAALSPVQPGLSALGCPQAARLARARRSGALGLVVAGSFLAGEDDSAPAGGDRPAVTVTAADAAVAVPGLRLRKPDGDALRDALCPRAAGGGCGQAGDLSASLVEMPGQWGGLRVVDITNPDAPRQVEVYRTARAAAASPADAGSSLAVHAMVADGTRVYVAWGSDGLRVVDLESGSPVEVASFLPPEPADLTGGDSARSLVTGVDHTADHVVVSDLGSGLWVLDKRPPTGTRGYWLADSAGGVYAFGDAPFAGSAAGTGIPAPVVGMAPSSSGRGYRLVTSEGGVYAFGDASFEGSLAGVARPAPVVGMATTPSGRGYWLASADGGVYAFGDAPFLGSLAATRPARPVVAVLATPPGKGYWLVAEDGGVFAFGDAAFLGSTAAAPPARPVVGAGATSSGRGYWRVAEDGGVFAFGDARFRGSLASEPRWSSPVVGLAPVTGVKGYWLADAGGGVYGLGAPFLGARPDGPRAAPVVAVAPVPRTAVAR